MSKATETMLKEYAERVNRASKHMAMQKQDMMEHLWPGKSEPSGPQMIYPLATQSANSSVPRAVLTISDVERLAKAGIQMNYADIAEVLRPDPPHKEAIFTSDWLVRPILERWKMSPGMARDPFNGIVEGLFLSAAKYRDKVFVFVATGNQPPMIIEDEAHMYPSDALMASLHLLVQLHRNKQGQDLNEIADATQTPPPQKAQSAHPDKRFTTNHNYTAKGNYP